MPPPGLVLGTVALTLVTALVAGPYALIVPALAVLARFKPWVLVPVALAGMAGAGVLAAVGAGSAVGEGQGAFGHVAQALALLALAAALVTLPARGHEGGHERGYEPVGAPAAPVFGPRPPEFDPPGPEQPQRPAYPPEPPQRRCRPYRRAHRRHQRAPRPRAPPRPWARAAAATRT